MSLLQRRLTWQRRQKAGPDANLQVAILATFTSEPLVPYLGMALIANGHEPAIHVGPYDRIAPECLDDASETAAYRPDCLVVFARLEDTADPLDLADVAAAAAARWGAALLFVLPALPEARPLGAGDAQTTQGVVATATATREALRAQLAGRPGVLLADMEDVVRRLGSPQALAPQLQAVARIPYTEAAFAALGEGLARLVRLARRAPCKVVVLDADNTLWGGVVGEDGVNGIALSPNTAGEAFTDFQSYLLQLRQAGVLLALCSKNQEADVWAAFARPEMKLAQTDLAAWRANWEPKSANLRAMSDELGLGLDSFVLIDDSPFELAEVAANAPEVATIRFPEDPAEWLATIQGAGLLDRLPPTAEDRARAGQYATETTRRIAHATDPAAYLASLGLAVRVFTPGDGDMPRLAQLVAKTNQFNATGRRRDAADLAALVADPAAAVRLISAHDKFGDYGTIGAYVVLDGALDTFLLSCRALARGVEEAMLAAAQADGATRATVLPLPRNEPARRFFARQGVPADGADHPLLPCAWPAHVASPVPAGG